MSQIDHEAIRRRVYTQYRRRGIFTAHALIFMAVLLGSFFFLRNPAIARVLPFAYVIWAMLISIHAIYLYMSERGQRAAEEAIARAEARAEQRKRKRDEESMLDEGYVVGPDGELIEPGEDELSNGFSRKI